MPTTRRATAARRGEGGPRPDCSSMEDHASPRARDLPATSGYDDAGPAPTEGGRARV